MGAETEQDALEPLRLGPRAFALPIRHFSPACARRVTDALEATRPDVVLVEGPSDFVSIAQLAHPELEPPVALHAFVRVGSEQAAHTRFVGWYPFPAHAPELAAIRWAVAAGAKVRFVDLPSHVRVRRGPERLRPDEAALAAALRRARCEDLGELWDAAFEVDERPWASFFARVARYGAWQRALIPDAASVWRAREAHMGARVRLAKGDRVALVCGASHVEGVRAHVDAKTKVPKFEAPPASQRGVHLTAYSDAQLAELGDGFYGLADPAPAFGRLLLEEADSTGGWSTGGWWGALQLAAEAARADQTIVSTADLVAAADLARRLAIHRGRRAPVRADLLDAIGTTWARGALEEHDPRAAVVRAFRGDAVGRPPRVDEPPLTVDVRTQLGALRLPRTLKAPSRELRLRPVRSARDREKAELLQRLVYLDVPYGAQEAGPRFLEGQDLQRVEQRWQLAWTEEVERALDAVASLGPDLAQATLQRLRERADDDPPSAERATARVVEACALGLHAELPRLLRMLGARIDLDGQLPSVLGALHGLWMLETFRDGFRFGESADEEASAQAYVVRAWGRALTLLPDFARVSEEAEPEALAGLQSLAHVGTSSADPAIRFDALLERLADLESELASAPGIELAARALRWSHRAEGLAGILDALGGHLLEADRWPDAPGRAFAGLFVFSRRAYLEHPRLLTGVSARLGALEHPRFVAGLPGLRRAHAMFTPSETAQLAREVARRFGGGRAIEADVGEVDAGDLGARVESALAAWGLAREPAAPRERARGSAERKSNVEDTGERDPELLLRWRLVLGRFAEDALPLEALAGECAGAGAGEGAGVGTGEGEGEGSGDTGSGTGDAGRGMGKGTGHQTGTGAADLAADAVEIDRVLGFLFDREYREEARAMRGGARAGGQGGSGLTVPSWISGLQRLFPRRVCERIETLAFERYGLEEIVTDPDVLERLEPNVRLLDAVLRLKGRMEGRVLDVARRVVRKVAEDLSKRLKLEADRVFSSRRGQVRHTTRGRHRDFAALRTIARNLRHYDRARRRLVVEQPWFATPHEPHPWRVIVCVDQSGSMLDSVVHASVVASVFTRIRRIEPRLVAFDTSVVDLSGQLDDPVETLMSVQLGGGTDIHAAIQYCQSLVTEPRRTLLVLITDLYEGGDPRPMIRRVAQLLEDGAKVLVMGALDDREGTPMIDRQVARQLASLGASVAALSPEELVRYVAEVVR